MKVLVTGGCGFIGCNTASRLMQTNHEVVVFDDLSRSGSERNYDWLKTVGDFEFIRGDIRDAHAISAAMQGRTLDAVIHLAAQVAVTTSVSNPRNDFEINALGTFNVLEAVRTHSPSSVVINASTNKVYGKLHDLPVTEEATRYSLPGLKNGVSESQSLDFHSPYGCSKGAADQYVADYARIFGLRTVNMRQSCIYGYRQFGVEDQGWVAWFTIAHSLRMPVSIYGTGKQVRDILFVDDLVDCYLLAIEKIDRVAGKTFNIGGGPSNSLSLIEFLEMLANLAGRPVETTLSDWRPGDQPVYISNIELAARELEWVPRISAGDGVRKLHDWVSGNPQLFEHFRRNL